MERKPTGLSPPSAREEPEPTPRDMTPRDLGDLTPAAVAEMKKLKDILQQRDNEISILFIKQNKQHKKHKTKKNYEFPLSKKQPKLVIKLV